MKIYYSMIIEGEKILKYSIGFGAPSHIITSPEDLEYAKKFHHKLRIQRLNKNGLIEVYDLPFREINTIYDFEDLEKWMNES